MKTNNYIGIDLGGTKCAVVLGSSGEAPVIREIVRFSTADYPDPRQCLSRLFGEIDGLLDRHKLSAASLAGVGISCGGPLDSELGVIQSPPNLPGWVDVPIVELVQQRLGVHTVLENDANACAMAEWKFGAGKGCRNLVFLTCGTGLGAGLILDGRLYRGTSGMAGELGHIRLERYGPVGYGKMGSVEGFCSGGGIAQMARFLALEGLQKGLAPSYCPDHSALDAITARSVAEAAERGDPTALAVYREFAQHLGRSVAILVDLLNPERVIIGSIYQRNEQLLSGLVYQVLEQECLPQALSVCRVVGAALGDEIGNYAALSLVME